MEMSRLGGGIGTRGPGETQLETDRRRIARRIKKIEDELEGVRTGPGAAPAAARARSRWRRWRWQGTRTPGNRPYSTG